MNTTPSPLLMEKLLKFIPESNAKTINQYKKEIHGLYDIIHQLKENIRALNLAMLMLSDTEHSGLKIESIEFFYLIHPHIKNMDYEIRNLSNIL